VECYYWVSNS